MIKWLITAGLLLAAVLVGITFYIQPNDFNGCSSVPEKDSDRCQSADAIVVVSGGDTFARSEAGIELYKNGWARAIVFSGAAQDKSGPSNAATMKEQALAAGVPMSAIYIDEFSNTTQENAENSQSIFESHGFEEVILVTSGYHQRRAYLEFEKRAGAIEILNYPVINDRDWSSGFWWLSPRGWWLVGGETVKIIVFYVSGAAR